MTLTIVHDPEKTMNFQTATSVSSAWTEQPRYSVSGHFFYLSLIVACLSGPFSIIFAALINFSLRNVKYSTCPDRLKSHLVYIAAKSQWLILLGFVICFGILIAMSLNTLWPIIISLIGHLFILSDSLLNWQRLLANTYVYGRDSSRQRRRYA